MEIMQGTLHGAHANRTRLLFNLLLTTLGIVVLLQGLAYWAVLLGVAGPGHRFDQLTTDARMLNTTLAVILPFAGLGLWFRSTWGVVVWLFCAGLQFLMHTVWQASHGTNSLLITFNLAAAMGIAVCVGALAFDRIKARHFTGN